MKKILMLIGIGLILVISILLIRTAQFTTKQFEVQPLAELTIDKDQIAHRLAKVLRFKTISYQDSTQLDQEAFLSFHEYLQEAFPNVHASLEEETINDYSLLFTWKGRDENLKPILFMAHQDVVPVTQETEEDWAYPPFEGKISEGYIWGRGALDMKFSLMGILEAVEILVREGFQPKRTVFLALGHDEEIGGLNGANRIADLLRSRSVRLEYVLDEGLAIVRDVIPGISGPVALIGIAEKGYVSLELKVKSEGGHSSMPPRHTAVGILSKAIVRLEENPFPANMTYTAQFFERVGPKMPFLRKIIFANLWLFNPLVKNMLTKSPAMNAGIRTTTAATMFNGSSKENVLPIQATAVVNFRILPGENITGVVNYVTKTIDDPRVQIRPMSFSSEPSPASDIYSRGYEVLRNTIHQIAEDKEVIVAPHLVLGATDSRYFTGLSDNVYRFFPTEFYPEDLKRVHGTNERISIENYTRAVKFYYQLLRNSEGL